MSSILTNTSAMVALQTMKGINANLNKTQADIATGKSIASAKDNAAVWAIRRMCSEKFRSTRRNRSWFPRAS